MTRRSRFSQEIRERAVRMVIDHGAEYDSRWEAITSIAEKIGCAPETLRKWLLRAEVDSGARALNQFRFQVEHAWGKWLSRRSSRGMTWERFNRLLRRYPLPEVVIFHRSS